MDYQIQRRPAAIAPAAGRSPMVGYVNAGMAVALGLGFIFEGFWLARDPAFAVGGAFAGATLALGALSLIFGGGSLFALLRDRR
jgi:hypothetical protein